MTPDAAADLAARTLAVIPADVDRFPGAAADRERVASDLAGLRACWASGTPRFRPNEHATRYADGLRRTAALYGVTP